MGGTTMKSETNRSTTAATEPVAPADAAAQAITTRLAPATQTPHLIGYELQQFVRLAGAQCRMSADKIAFHNRAHDRSRL
jgi:hypothetical protein